MYRLATGCKESGSKGHGGGSEVRVRLTREEEVGGGDDGEIGDLERRLKVRVGGI